MSHQVDLFGGSRVDEIRKEVKELDRLIEKAMKKNEYALARELTQKQEHLLKELVEAGDDESL